MKFLEDKKNQRMLAWWGVAALLVVLLTIRAMNPVPEPKSRTQTPAAQTAAEPTFSARDLNEGTLLSILWMERSAEYRALCYQAYNVALERVKWAVVNHRKGDNPLAIVLDCDATVMTDDQFQACLLTAGVSHNPELWGEWVADEAAKAMPGAADFLQTVDSLGVDIFYVTNRASATQYPELAEATMKNMTALGFPQVSPEHMMFKGENGNKAARFAEAAASHDVVLYLGDNINDLPLDLYGKNMAEREATTDRNSDRFGMSFIMLPNPVYGSWEGALAEGYSKLSPAEKDKVRREALDVWKLKK